MQKKWRKIKMKKKILTICLLLSVFTIAVYAETEQDEINQVLSVFKSYEYVGIVGSYSDPPRVVKYFVYDYNGHKYDLRFLSRSDGKSRISMCIEPYDNRDWNLDSYNDDYRHYSVQEFINKVRADSRIALSSGGQGSKQIAQTPNQNSSSQGTVSSQQLSTQSRSQSSSTTVAIPSGTLYELYDWNNSYKNPTIITDCINSIDVRNIKDNDIILITNLTLTQPGNNLIMFQDRHGHRLYEDLYGRSDSVFYFLPRTGHPDWWDVRLSECAKGKWDKYTQSYGKTTPISVYAKIKRDSKDDYLELLGFILPN